MKIEVSDDFVTNMTVASLKENLEILDNYLREYKKPDHGWIVVFDTDQEKDKKQIRKMRSAMHHVLTNWYGVEE